MAALQACRGERTLGVGGGVSFAGGDLELGGLDGVGEVVALEELVAGNLPVLGALAQAGRAVVVVVVVVVGVVGPLVVALGDHGR